MTGRAGSRNRPRRHVRAAFTLIEVLMVVTALAIMAGVVVPQVGSAIDDARYASMLAQQRQLATAIERYRMDHNGGAPDRLDGHSLLQLLSKTNAAGVVGTTPAHPFGPYITNMPVNPLNNSRDVFRSNSVPPTSLTSRVGWVYHPESGQIWAGLYQGEAP